MRKRVLSAHLLRDWDWEDGIVHESDLPPTKISLASDEKKMVPRRRKASKREEEDDLEKPAMETEKEESVSRERKHRECVSRERERMIVVVMVVGEWYL